MPDPTKAPSAPTVAPTASPNSTPNANPTDEPTINENNDSYCLPKCKFSPCMCFENPSCCDCDNEDGCNKCEDGYFQLSKNHRCASCSDRLGEACNECEDYKGCVECDSGHELYYDEECQLWSCKPECSE